MRLEILPSDPDVEDAALHNGAKHDNVESDGRDEESTTLESSELLVILNEVSDSSKPRFEAESKSDDIYPYRKNNMINIYSK